MRYGVARLAGWSAGLFFDILQIPSGRGPASKTGTRKLLTFGNNNKYNDRLLTSLCKYETLYKSVKSLVFMVQQWLQVQCRMTVSLTCVRQSMVVGEVVINYTHSLPDWVPVNGEHSSFKRAPPLCTLSSLHVLACEQKRLSSNCVFVYIVGDLGVLEE